jgi:hypothetical protein
VILTVPAPIGVNVTEQLPVFRLQLVAGLKDPPVVPAEVNLTVPVGVLAVPDPVSATVAVQVEPLLASTDEGAQLTIVELGRPITVNVND